MATRAGQPRREPCASWTRLGQRRPRLVAAFPERSTCPFLSTLIPSALVRERRPLPIALTFDALRRELLSAADCGRTPSVTRTRPSSTSRASTWDVTFCVAPKAWEPPLERHAHVKVYYDVKHARSPEGRRARGRAGPGRGRSDLGLGPGVHVVRPRGSATRRSSA